MPRLRRWAKRLGLALLELLVVLTMASLVYNAATADGVKPVPNRDAIAREVDSFARH
jgi:hypothetical protein